MRQIANFGFSQVKGSIRGLLVLLFIVAASACAVPGSDATQWYVSRFGNDNNSCHSRSTACRNIGVVVNRAKSGDTIHIANGTYNENLILNKSIMLKGQSNNGTIIDGRGKGSVITIPADPDGIGYTVDVEDLFITDGASAAGAGMNVSGNHSLYLRNLKIIGNLSSDRGGGLYVNSTGLVVLDKVEVMQNSALNEGGGIYFVGGPVGYAYFPMEISASTISGNDGLNGGGIYSNGRLSISNSTIEKNRARDSGGGLYNVHELTVILSKVNNNIADLTGGGICSEDSEMEGNPIFVNETTIDGNRAKEGGGIYNRGILSLKASTISNNIAQTNGGGVWNGGIASGKWNYFYSINSTISGNSALSGGGIWNGLIEKRGYFSGNLEFVNLTIANNRGEGIYAHAGKTLLRNVLISGNPGGNCDITVSMTQKNNLSDDPTCQYFIQGKTLIGPLANNGGPTLTHKLLPGSPAIDRAIDTAGLITDQRNISRPCDGSWDKIADMDIGSYEAEYNSPP
jgi:hypothetical protein